MIGGISLLLAAVAFLIGLLIILGVIADNNVFNGAAIILLALAVISGHPVLVRIGANA